MKRHHSILPGLILVIFSIGYDYANTGSVYANTSAFNYDKCIKKADINIEIIKCNEKNTIYWDKKLNQYYKILMSKLDSGQKDILQKSQRRWIKYRDQEILNVKSIYSKLQGTMTRPWASYRIANMTKLRAEDLKHFIKLLEEN